MPMLTDTAPSPASESTTNPDPAVIEAAEAVAEEATEIVAEATGEAAEATTEKTFDRKAYWTPERRAALSEKMKRKHEPSAFALTDEHEFPTSPSPPPPVDLQHNRGILSTVPAPDNLIAAPPPPPGTPSSPYRRCPCLAVLPGRVCTFCYGTKWTKLCPKCSGEGRINLVVRKGAERSMPCGNCGGRGTLPANTAEITEAARLAEEFAAGPEGQAALAAAAVDDLPDFRRAVRLPGIGVTATKRGGTLAAKRREQERYAKRRQARAKAKAKAGATN